MQIVNVCLLNADPVNLQKNVQIAHGISAVAGIQYIIRHKIAIFLYLYPNFCTSIKFLSKIPILVASHEQ